MKKNIILLRTIYIYGMIADLFEGIRMSFPKLFIASSGAMLKETPELSSGLLYGLPVMIGWTLVLFWQIISLWKERESCFALFR